MAAQAIGSLFVSLGLDTAAFSAGVKQAQGRTAAFAANLNKKLSGLGNVPGVAKLQAGLASMTAGVAAAAGAATAAAAVALSAMSVSAINTAAELKNLSALANATPEEFQKMAYAAEQVGISQEKFSDILKDVNDRVGDFIATGGGPMADFFEKIAPKVGVTADQFRKLSGPQALQLYVDSLEKANVNQQDFTFFMEAMASDSTALVPILRNGGKAAQEYAARLEALGGVMSNETVARLAAMKTALNEVGVVMSGIKNSLGAAFAPIIEAAARTFVMMFEAGQPLRILFDGLVAVVGFLANVLSALTTIVTAVWKGMWEAVSAGAAWLNNLTGLGATIKAVWDNTIGGIARVLVWFANLIRATGSIGAALSQLGDLAGLVWQGMIGSAQAIPSGLEAVWHKVRADFFAMLRDMAEGFAKLATTLAGASWDAGFTGLADSFVEMSAAATGAASYLDHDFMEASWAAADAAANAAGVISEAFGPARDKLASMTQSTEAAAAAMSGGAGGSGLAQAVDGAGSKGKEAAAKLTPLQEVMKRLRAEAARLTATLNMSELDAKIWDDLKEAGVSISSQAGQSIAALNQQIDALNKIKGASERGKQALTGLFGSFLEGASAAKQAVMNLLLQMAQIQFAKGMLGLIGGTSWGGSLIKTIGGLLGENANGTNHWRGGMTRINERGEEIVELPSGSKVFPHGLSKRMADGAAHGDGGSVQVIASHDPGIMVKVIDSRIDAARPTLVRQSVGAAMAASKTTKSAFR